MGKKSSSSTKQQFADYFMSIHFGACLGPVDACTGIYVGEKIAWEGTQEVEGAIIINQPSMWGGQLKEGGLLGQAYYLPGGPTQVMPETLAARLGKTSDTCPGFRGLASLFFSAPGAGFVGSQGFFPGFKWGTNSPYLRPVWARFFRKPTGISPELALIETTVERHRTVTQVVGTAEQEVEVTDTFVVQDGNPSHIIYECLTNPSWGMGASSTQLDVESFEYAAQVFFNEKFGLSFMWTQQAPIESFVTEVLEHVQATLFVDPRNGLLSILPIRDDYDVDSLRILTPDNSVLTNFQQKAWGETINEIIVTWTNPANEQEETVVQQDLGNIAMQGGVVSDSRNYYGVRSETLAFDLAARDLRSAAAPLVSCDIEVDRSAWDLVPGEVVKLTWPEYDIDQIVMRVGQVDYGKIGDSKIKASMVQDIFALAYTQFHAPQNSLWQDPSQQPAPITTTQVITVPYYLVKQAATNVDLEYPDVVAAVFATQVGSDTIGFELYEEQPTTTGGVAFQSVGSKLLTPRAALVDPLVREATSVIEDFTNIIGGVAPEVGGLMMVGTGLDETMELMLVASFADGLGWTVRRGILDTVPREWPAGAPVWFITSSNNSIDPTLYGAGSTVKYKLATRTSLGTLDLADAPEITRVLNERPHLPNRPANVAVEGDLWGPVTVTSGTPEVAVTWANRNRVLEETQIRLWTEGNVTPEDGQTTVIQILDQSQNLVTEHDALAGTSFDVPIASFEDLAQGIVRVISRRDDLDSLQGMEILVSLSDRIGYGFDYGNNYDGA